METKKKYQSPQLAVVLFNSERGYAISGFGLAILESSRNEGSENIEERRMSESGWGAEWNY